MKELLKIRKNLDDREARITVFNNKRLGFVRGNAWGIAQGIYEALEGFFCSF